MAKRAIWHSVAPVALRQPGRRCFPGWAPPHPYLVQRQMAFTRGLNYPFADILDARQRDFTRLRPDEDTTTPG